MHIIFYEILINKISLVLIKIIDIDNSFLHFYIVTNYTYIFNDTNKITNIRSLKQTKQILIFSNDTKKIAFL